MPQALFQHILRALYQAATSYVNNDTMNNGCITKRILNLPVLHVLKLTFLIHMFVKLFNLNQNNINIKFVDNKPQTSPAETSLEGI